MATNILTTSDILNYIKSFIKAKNPQIDVQTGTDIYDLIFGGNAQTSARIFESIQEVENLQSVFTTFGSSLDTVSRNYSLVRKPATVSLGYVIFYTTTWTTDIIIPEGTVLSTKNTVGLPNVTFRTIGDISLLFSNKSAYFNSTTGRYESTAIPIACTIPGKVGNVDMGTVTTLQTNIPQIEGITNNDAISGGTDEETDIDLQQRCALSLVVSSVGTQDGYKKLILDNEVVKDVYAVGPFDTESVRSGVDIYALTVSAPVTYTQTNTYGGANFTELINQPVLDINSVIAYGTWSMLENVSYQFNKQAQSAYANSTISDSTVARIDWVPSWAGVTLIGSIGGDTFTYAVSGGEISVTSADAYVNTRVTMTLGSNNPGETQTVLTYSYNTTSNIVTFTTTPFTNAINAGDPFTLDPRPNIGDSVSINYNYNPDIAVLQDFVEQSQYNVVGANTLVKNGLRGKLALTLSIKVFSGYDFVAAKTKVEGAVSQYINNLKFGDDIQTSDIIVTAQTGIGTDYVITEVDYVSVDTLSSSTFFEHWDETIDDFSAVDIITLSNREYAILKTLTIN